MKVIERSLKYIGIIKHFKLSSNFDYLRMVFQFVNVLSAHPYL